MTKPTPAKLKLSHSNFFAFRTPLLPWSEFLSFSNNLESPAAHPDAAALKAAIAADRSRLSAHLQQQLTRPEVAEAVFIASPSLHESLDAWRQDPDSPRGQKTERALVRYFARMTARPTPFGLFAGCSVGTIGVHTHLQLESSAKNRRHTRLDNEYVLSLAESLARDPALRPHLTFTPNTTLYRAAGQIRYAETRVVDGQRSHHLVAVDDSDYLAATLERAASGARPAHLAAALVDEDVTLEDATSFIDELIDSQLLESDLQPTVTGPEPIHALIESLRSLPAAAEVVERLVQVREAIGAMESAGHATTDQYQHIVSTLKPLPAKVDASRLFQVDMFKPAPHVTLSSAVIDEMQRGVELLAKLVDREPEDSLSRFRAAFTARYEGREAPLVEALDEEIGIGFDRSTAPGADGGPLLADIAIPQRSGSAPAAWKPRHAVLLAKLLASRDAGVQHIELTDADVQQMSSADPPPIPASLSVTATLAASSAEALDAGDFRLLLTNAIGPSGAKMLGRFCHGDEQLEQRVREHLRAEEALNPDAVFAEIVHLPEGRMGNVILRPVLREYEIPYVGRSGAPTDKQLAITDLRVSIQAGRIVLRSASLNREIIPRLTNAHNYSWKGLGLYKFLCALQHQDVSDGLYWDWGPLESSEFLPRVTHGKLVLSRARWLLQSPELKTLLAAKDAELFTAVQTLRRDRKLPRFVALRDSDNELPVDLDNILSIESLIDVLKGRELATLVEMFPVADELTAVGPEGRFTHELVVPLLDPPPSKGGARGGISNRRQSHSEKSSSVTLAASPSTSRRRFAPGSEWLYAKIYTGAATADRLLRDELRPVIDDAVATGACDRWFFLRYGDPDGHLRLRFHGDPARLREELLPRLEQALAGPLNAGWVARVQFDTYDRETERYGGDRGVELAEELFHADSEAALSIIDTCSGDAGLDARWRLALRGIDQLLDDLGFDLAEKSEIMQRARDNFAREFGVGADFKQQSSARFRVERASLEALLNRACDHESLLQPGLAALDRRSAQLRHVASQLRDAAAAGDLSAHPSDLAGSYIHMWVNRILRSAHRAQELVLYDFLARLYQSAAARAPEPRLAMAASSQQD